MAPWMVVVCTALAVSVPLIVGWWYSEVRRRRELDGWATRVQRLQEQVGILNEDLADATRRANALLAAFSVEREDSDLSTCMSALHNALQGKTLELSALRRKHATVLGELVELRREGKHLRALANQTLVDNQEFQLHLAQVTDERDRMKMGLLAAAPQHVRLQMKAMRDELEELRFKLKIANRAIVEMEQAMSAVDEGDESGVITAPMLRQVSAKPYTA